MKKLIFIFYFIFILSPAFACLPLGTVLAADTIDINTATLSQLDELTGIGPAKAQAIINARPFSLVDELDRVKGIGPKILQEIKSQGVACVNCATSVTTSASQADNKPPTPVPTQDPTPTIVYPTGIFINEILPNPSGADETNEWVELYNSNSTDVDLSGWQIQDTGGTPTTFTITQGLKILANGFLIFKRPDTKIMLNNNSDGINLLTPDKKIVDSATYSTAPLGQSYNKTSSGWTFSTTATPGAENIITTKAHSTSSGPKGLSKAKNSANNDLATQGLADISQSLDQNNLQKNNPWYLFFTVLVTTVVLATIILFIKLRFSKKTI